MSHNINSFKGVNRGLERGRIIRGILGIFDYGSDGNPRGHYNIQSSENRAMSAFMFAWGRLLVTCPKPKDVIQPFSWPLAVEPEATLAMPLLPLIPHLERAGMNNESQQL